MNKESLEKLKEKISELSEEEQKLRNLYLRRISAGEMYGPMTGYASIDKPWLKFFNDDSIEALLRYKKENIKKYSLAIFNILNCKDMSRIDWLYDVDNNKLYFNEINTIPGFTEISMYPKLLNDLNISNKEIITILLGS